MHTHSFTRHQLINHILATNQIMAFSPSTLQAQVFDEKDNCSNLTLEVSAQLGTVTRLPIHPVSLVLLTRIDLLGALDSLTRLNKAAVLSYLFKV
ncbi:hypothetical protein Scep_024191 [Stephania cephalantha]|uniref:Uncharacterized protein n=1 Tax=Stephania cephalantha TaxID=152367 RepID=A0AAP0EW41_9MAGN